MIRPEVIARILRWREVLVGLGALVLGLWWAFTSVGTIRWIGVVVAIGGVAILREGAQRLRRPAGGGGAGIVHVMERQVTYLSGEGGGAVSLDSLERVEILGADGTATWGLIDAEGRAVRIPADAERSDALFDALVALPGFPEDDAVSALARPEPGRRVIWDRGAKRLG